MLRALPNHRRRRPPPGHRSVHLLSLNRRSRRWIKELGPDPFPLHSSLLGLWILVNLSLGFWYHYRGDGDDDTLE